LSNAIREISTNESRKLISKVTHQKRNLVSLTFILHNLRSESLWPRHQPQVETPHRRWKETKAFPDFAFAGTADLIAEGDYVVGRWEGGGTHIGPVFSDFLVGSLPAATGRKMRFTGTTVLRIENGKIAEDIGLDDGVTALQQFGQLIVLATAKRAFSLRSQTGEGH
jgi:predicted ester cyclase